MLKNQMVVPALAIFLLVSPAVFAVDVSLQQANSWIFVETGVGGQNSDWYHETVGTWQDSPLGSSSYGLTNPTVGSRFAGTGNTGLHPAFTLTPVLPRAGGSYDVYMTIPGNPDDTNLSRDIVVNIATANGSGLPSSTTLFRYNRLSSGAESPKWAKLGTLTLAAGQNTPTLTFTHASGTLNDTYVASPRKGAFFATAFMFVDSGPPSGVTTINANPGDTVGLDVWISAPNDSVISAEMTLVVSTDDAVNILSSSIYDISIFSNDSMYSYPIPTGWVIGTAGPIGSIADTGVTGTFRLCTIYMTLADDLASNIMLGLSNISLTEDTTFQQIPDVMGHRATIMIPGAPEITPILPSISSAVSRKVHGSAGQYRLDLMTSNVVEGRYGGPTQILVTFDTPIQCVTDAISAVTLTSGTVDDISIASNAQDITIYMSGVTDRSILTMQFPGFASVYDETWTCPSTLCFGVMKGDIASQGSTATDGVVNIYDLIAVKSSIDQSANDTNFAADVTSSDQTTPDGVINIYDIIAVKSNFDRLIQGSCSAQ